jgi:dTDP-4-amino-4,6-dideoxygalactose transaminase
MQIANKYSLFVIEDNAQAQGATCKGRFTGSWGHINATSFYPGKNLGALGDGGAINTNDNKLANKVQALRNYGSKKKYHNDIVGFNSRLDEVQACWLRIKLKHLNNDNDKRNRIADLYISQLKDIKEITLPHISINCTHVFHLFVIRIEKRDELYEFLKSKNIETLIHYPIPPHLQKAYEDLKFKKGDFPIAEELASTSLSLPIYPGLHKDKVEYICNCIKMFTTK